MPHWRELKAAGGSERRGSQQDDPKNYQSEGLISLPPGDRDQKLQGSARGGGCRRPAERTGGPDGERQQQACRGAVAQRQPVHIAAVEGAAPAHLRNPHGAGGDDRREAGGKSGVKRSSTPPTRLLALSKQASPVSRTLYIRNVPDDVAERLERLAGRAGLPLSTFALRELSEAARRADNADLLQALPSAELGPGEILEALRQSRAEP
jgi:hypothetical protein